MSKKSHLEISNAECERSGKETCKCVNSRFLATERTIACKKPEQPQEPETKPKPVPKPEPNPEPNPEPKLEPKAVMPEKPKVTIDNSVTWFYI